MFRFDRNDLEFGFAAAAATVLAGLMFVMLAWGGAAASGVFGFVLTGLAWAGAPVLSPRSAIAFGLIGGLLTFLAFTAAGEAGWSAMILGAVAFLAALATARSPGVAVGWSLLSIWTLLALLIVDKGTEIEAAISFVVGSALATGVTLMIRRARGAGGPPQEAHATPIPSPLRWFALLKGVAVAVAVLIGFWWLPLAPYWVALTVLIVAQPDDKVTAQTAVHRSVGTLLGVAIGLLVVSLAAGHTTWVGAAVILLVFCQMLFLRVNYVLFATFLTALIVVSAALSNGEVGEVGWSRILATVVGSILAVVVTAVVARAANAKLADRAGTI